MMLLLTCVAVVATLLCPLTLPFWVFVIAGFHFVVRKDYRARYVRRHGAPAAFSTDWWLLNV